VKIIVAEDDRAVRELVEFKLSSAGHDVRLEEDGQAALDAIRSDRPDVVVLDWMMPNLTGIEVCEAIRADPELAGLPVLLLTARAQEADMERGKAAGVDEYLVKPFSPKDLLERVEKLVRNR
jgi:two-component system, OmpR family, response regulator MtrA